jgi:hypothetical protein
VEETVRIVRVPCGLGGFRSYFACPGVVSEITCGRRIVKLYAHEIAFPALRADTQEWWEDELASDPDGLEEDEEPATADAAGLRRFLEEQVLPGFENRKKELANRALIRE